MKITRTYFNDEVLRFRKMFGSTEYMGSIDGLDKLMTAFGALFHVYLNATISEVHPDTTPEDIEAMDLIWESTYNEYEMRKSLVLTGSIPTAPVF